MQLSVPVNLKETSQLIAGEVFRMQLSGAAALCMALDTDETGRRRVAILQSESKKPLPVWFVLQTEAFCLSYGPDCVIEPEIGPNTAPGVSYQDRFGAGVLTLHAGGGLSIMLNPFDSFSHTEASFDLSTNAMISSAPNNYDVYFLKWCIWPSQTEKERAGGKPLFEFAYQEPSA